MRKYLRAIARANMERAGIQRINKRRHAVNPRTGMIEKNAQLLRDELEKVCRKVNQSLNN